MPGRFNIPNLPLSLQRPNPPLTVGSLMRRFVQGLEANLATAHGPVFDADGTCPICTRRMLGERNRLIPPCRHAMHGSCGLGWAYRKFQLQTPSTCPMCRSDMMFVTERRPGRAPR